MNSATKFQTFLAQKVVFHRNQAENLKLEAKNEVPGSDAETVKLQSSVYHSLFANTVEAWITEVRNGAVR